MEHAHSLHLKTITVIFSLVDFTKVKGMVSHLKTITVISSSREVKDCFAF